MRSIRYGILPPGLPRCHQQRVHGVGNHHGTGGRRPFQFTAKQVLRCDAEGFDPLLELFTPEPLLPQFALEEMSATAMTGPYQLVALHVAIVHFLYNALGAALFAAIPPLYRLPMQSAQALANAARRSPLVVPGYILGVFFVIPGLVFAGQSIFGFKSAPVVEAEANKAIYGPLQKAVDAVLPEE